MILAAGGSSRLGEPKQLLPYKGNTLLRQAAETALNTGWQPIVVVVGAHHEAISKTLTGMKITLAENHEWNKGMSTSLQAGLAKAEELAPDLDALIFMVCDQPMVTTTLLQELLKTHWATGKPIVACSYKDVSGTPALFAREVFPSLRDLTGDAGARKLIKTLGNKVATIDFPDGYIDIDTKNDYESFIQPEKWKTN
ncbi:nucleotidyltransferase family protein [Flavihumibacter fluvii]|uniref:nucleotidyltransferase family protein n=1 Tax=Flavihumibacter fluvii TaxID=2838157 RepID=UPI001BDE5307|nr:nucleotidyltransferase family protein [Flavihumibacter fluvii]ULQ52747.1 nucleotidyltransferase family protein [Flavihumibacter fluvii]